MVRLFVFIAIGALLWPSFGQKPAVSRQLANIVGPQDDRKPLYLHAKDLYLSDEEVAHLRAAVGYVNCGNPRAWVTGFLISDKVVVTVAHIFRTPEGKPTAPVQNCFFESQGANPGVRYHFSANAGDVILGSENPHNWRARDFAVGRLQKSVVGGRALPIFLGRRTFHPGEGLLPVTAFREEKFRQPGDLNAEPLGQLCTLKRVLVNSGSESSEFYSDCDNTTGGSGSPVLQRLYGNTITVMGMFVAGGIAPDKTEYREQPANAMSLAHSVLLDGDFLKTALSLR